MRLSLTLVFFVTLIAGLIFIYLSFFAIKLKHLKPHQKQKHQLRSLIFGWTGALLLFFSGLMAIYIYSSLPTSQRILNDKTQHKNEFKLPDLGAIPSCSHSYLVQEIEFYETR